MEGWAVRKHVWMDTWQIIEWNNGLTNECSLLSGWVSQQTGHRHNMCVRTNMYVCVFVHIYARMHTGTNVCIPIHINVCTHVLPVSVCLYVHMHVVCIYVFACVPTYICMYVCMYLWKNWRYRRRVLVVLFLNAACVYVKHYSVSIIWIT